MNVTQKIVNIVDVKRERIVKLFNKLESKHVSLSRKEDELLAQLRLIRVRKQVVEDSIKLLLSSKRIMDEK